jgi:hypothetical protein
MKSKLVIERFIFNLKEIQFQKCQQLTGYKKSWLVFQFVKVSSSNYFCSQGKLIGSEAATLFIPRR